MLQRPADGGIFVAAWWIHQSPPTILRGAAQMGPRVWGMCTPTNAGTPGSWHPQAPQGAPQGTPNGAPTGNPAGHSISLQRSTGLIRMHHCNSFRAVWPATRRPVFSSARRERKSDRPKHHPGSSGLWKWGGVFCVWILGTSVAKPSKWYCRSPRPIAVPPCEKAVAPAEASQKCER